MGAVGMNADLIADIGPDTVTLVFRDPAAGVDRFGRPNVTERLVVKGPGATPPTPGNAFLFDKRPTEERDAEGSVADIRRAGARLYPDADTLALKATDAIIAGGLKYELSGPAVPEADLDGRVDHVHIQCERIYSSGRGEDVTITPAGHRDDDGHVAPDGVPFVVTAYLVTPGNTTAKYGASGELVEADFTVVLPIDTPLADDDWVTVRGKPGRARIQTNLPQFADYQRLVVLVNTKAGGAM